MKSPLRIVVVALAALAFACGARAQTAPPPRDVSGVWSGGGKGSNRDLLLQPALKLMLPWVKAKLNTSDPDPSRELFAIEPDPFLQFCDPLGVPRVLLTNTPIKIVPTAGEVIMLYERNHDFREVYTDGREHPKDPDPSWWGHSIGRWDGNTFMVDSVGFNDKTWLDWSGLAHSEALHLVERYQRLDQKTMRVSITVDDPKAYTQSFTVQRMFTLEPWDIGEDICTHSSEQHFQQGIVQPGTATSGR
jgi:hypothetical protein